MDMEKEIRELRQIALDIMDRLRDLEVVINKRLEKLEDYASNNDTRLL